MSGTLVGGKVARFKLTWVLVGSPGVKLAAVVFVGIGGLSASDPGRLICRAQPLSRSRAKE